MSINEDEGTPLLESVGADTVPETSGGSELHKRHGHRPCPRRQKLSDRLRQHVERLKRTQYAPLKSLAGAGMGLVITTVGGLSIAANIFPSGTSLYYPEFYAAGLYWGLFCGAIANLFLLGFSRLPCGVGGTLLPAIIVIANYCESAIGPKEPTTVMMCYVLSTFTIGLVTIGLGRAGVLRPAFKLVPFPVLLGFLTSIGVSLFASALGAAVPNPATGSPRGGFTSLTDRQSWIALAAAGGPEKWVPGVGSACAVYFLQREWQWRPGWLVTISPYLPALVTVAMLVIVNHFSDAEKDGWMTPVQAGTSPSDMFRLWPWAHLHGSSANATPPTGWGTATITTTERDFAAREPGAIPSVKWDLIWGNGVFIITCLEAVVIGLLALLEDLAMVHKSTAMINPAGAGQVDIDREVQAQGMMNVVSAMLCGLPINLISSYSFAAMKLGGGGWIFYAAQAMGSVLCLVLADYIIQSLPNMLPCFILFWAALELALWGLWDLRPVGVCEWFGARTKGALGTTEYLLVVAMVVISLDPFQICDIDSSGSLQFALMMFVGIFFAFFNIVRLLRTMPALEVDSDVAAFRSEVSRTPPEAQVLAVEGRRVLVLRLHRTVVAFHNVGYLEHLVEEKVRERSAVLARRGDKDDCDGGRVVAVLLDVSQVQNFSYDAGQMFLEMLPLAAQFGFAVVICGATDAVGRKLKDFGAPIKPADLDPQRMAGQMADDDSFGAAEAIWCSPLRLISVIERYEDAILIAAARQVVKVKCPI